MSDFRQRIEKLSPKRLALLAIELQSKLEEKERERTEPIAIIGIGCRMPGSGSGPQAFWDLLAEGRDVITETPMERWDASAYYDPNPDTPGRMSTKLGSYLADIDQFDAPFFSIARREAVSMDPQQRLLLEVCWEALENAGHSPRKLSGSATGVVVGICSTDYHGMLLARGDEAIDAYVASGVSPSIAAGRISYTLGLQGPSMAIDTACSASLVAVHLACQSLHMRESRMALAGGVNLTLSPETTIALSKAHMMAPDGRCKTFDARADGFVRGEGCGIVVLKRLSDALADADNILAVIRASAVNQDGRSSGITAPNGAAQEALIRQALANGNLKPEEISFIEAHGTGTSLGDPIEAHALAAVLGPGRTKENPLVVGSVKTNVGHLESAAGVAGLIKLVLSLQHEQIPANLHFQKMNPHIDWGGVPVEIPVAPRPWVRGGKKRIAGLSSFGFSGTNAHLIVEEAPAQKERIAGLERPLHLLALSARSETALRELAERFKAELGETTEDPGDICFTANAGRAHFEHRLTVTGSTVADLRRKLKDRKAGTEILDRGGVRPVFLFSGQGSQYPGMGKQLYDSHGVFRKAIDECEELLKPLLEKPLREVLWGNATDLLEQTAYTQPALFALEYALFELWKSWGLVPGVVLGHSVGEYVAACVAGVYSLADGLKLIAARARLMQGVSGHGAMSAVMARQDRVREALSGLELRVSIAGLNAPESIVISGYEAELNIAEERLKQAGVRVQRLAVSHAFHSPQMAEMEAEFEAVARGIEYAAPRVKLISSVTGKEVGRGEISAGYWRRQVREPVRFQAAMETLRDAGQRVFVEVGPGSTLVGLGRQCLEAQEETGKPERMWAVSVRKSRGEWEQILESLGRLYERGAEVDWEGFDAGYARRRVALPTYPFQRQRYWIENSVRRPSQLTARAGAQDNLDDAAQSGRVPSDWFYQLSWEPKPQRSAPRQTGEARNAAELAEALDRRARSLEIEHGFDQYALLLPEFNQICSTYIVNALCAAGWNFPPGARATTEQLAAHCGIAERHRMLFPRLLEILAEDGLLSQEPDDSWTVIQAFVSSDPESWMQTLQERYPGFNAELWMTAHCAKSLAGVLQGKVDPLTLLFTGGSIKNAEKIYSDSPSPHVFNRLVADVVSAEVKARPDGMIRVLEIGAGTGGTTAFVAPMLPADRTEYVYTDISTSLKAKAAAKFKQYPFFRYETLDVEKDPAAQGFQAGQFDIIIAANVLHATADLRQTMARVRNLLSPEGVVVLLEGTYSDRWLNLTFGLTEGWWRFRDRDLRPTCPLISRQAWLDLLAEFGFADAAAAGLPGSQQVVFHARVPSAISKPERWLLVSDSKSAAGKLSERLAEAGGSADLSSSPEATLDQLKKNSYDCVLHLSTLESSESEILDPDFRAAGRPTLVSSVLATAQAMISQHSKAKLWLITSGAQSVTNGQPHLNMTQAQVWGLGRTFALEHPGSWGGLLDLDPHADRTECIAEVVSTILRRDAEDQLAFRGGKRYVARLSRRADLSTTREPHFIPQKTYVITGGLGGLGLQVAAWMVDHGARKLVLVGRRAASAEAQKIIETLTSRGARVEIRSADVAFKPSIESAFAEIVRTMGSIDGIVHAAGFIDDGLLEQQTSERMEKVLAPKVGGAWNLHAATAGMNLDFFVLFSSISALTGAAGTSSYAAANAFLDALAHYRNTLGLPALSIDWGAWEGEGMGKRLGGGTGRRAGVTLMPARLALAALGAALSIPEPQIAIGAIDWRVQKPAFEGATKRPLLEYLSTDTDPSIDSRVPRAAASTAGTASKHLQDLTSATPEVRRKELVKYLVAAVAPILAIEATSIDASRPLTDFGVDSLMALEFKNRVNSDLGVSIPTVRFLEGTSLQEIASQITAESPALSIPTGAQTPVAAPAKAVSEAPVHQVSNLSSVPPDQRQSWLANYLVASLAPILGVETSSVDSITSLSDFGLDSLMALEFKNHIATNLGVSIPTVRFLEGPSLNEIASQIANELPFALAAPSLISSSAPVVEYPLSYAQQHVWFIHKLMPESATFNVGFTAKASPHLHWPTFQRAVAKLAIRHAALRAVFIETDSGPVQRILPTDTPMAFLIEAAAMPEADLKELISRDYQQNFDLEKPLFRVNVYRRTDCDVIYIKVDHLIIDHWSVQLCFEDLKTIYGAELNSTEPGLPPLKGEYQDFVGWEAALDQNDELARQRDYWKEKLGGDLPTLSMPSSRQRPEALMARGEAIPLHLSPSLAARIAQVARPLKTTAYTFMLAAFQVLLHRFSHQDDIIVGTSSSGRENARWANTVGFFVNLLPMRTLFSGNPTFAEHLQHSRDTVFEALKNQEFPFALMMKQVKLRRGLDRMPVFQAFFNFLTDRSGEFGSLFMGIQGQPIQFGSSAMEPWLTLPLQEGRIEVGVQLLEAEGQVDGFLNYNSDVLDRSTAELMAAAYGKILEAVVLDPNTPIESLAQESDEIGSEREEIAL